MRETISVSAVWAQLSPSQAAGLSGHRVCQLPDPGRASLQNHERDEYMTVGQAPGLWYSCCSSPSRRTAPEPTLLSEARSVAVVFPRRVRRALFVSLEVPLLLLTWGRNEEMLLNKCV